MKVEATLMGGDLTTAGEGARKLEEQGFDTAISYEGPHDPFFPLAMAARDTERIELATGVAIAFARNPMICAQIANDLQLLSKGRFILGLGSQIKPHIEKRFSQPWSAPAARMREFVLAIRAIWASWYEGEKLDFRGEFYTHTIMTPVFNPGPNPFGAPKLFVAAVGPKMCEVTGEVGDGFFVHPLHTPSFIRGVTLPAIERGLATAGRKRNDFEISCQTIVMLGETDEQLAKARQGAKAQLSFYGSTPAYNVVLEHEGWDVHPELNRLSKQGKWLEMINLISDDMLDQIGVSGKPSEVGAKLLERNRKFAERTTLVSYNETGDSEAIRDVVRGLHGD